MEDIAINPINGVMFGLSRETTGNDLLITVDKNTGVSNVIGSAVSRSAVKSNYS